MTGVLAMPGPRLTAGGACSDHELVARIRGGDDRAFEILFERYQGRITAYIRGMVHDHGRAEDIAQEVFLNALRRMRATDRSIAFRPWIYEIAKNACIDAHRRSQRTREVSYDQEDSLGAADHGKLVSPGAVTDAVEARASLENLQSALGALSESHADVLVLRELEGLSYNEIGERLGMSRAAVESTLFRARKRLESEYNDLVSGERCRQIQALFTTMSSGRPRLRDRRQVARHLSWCQACRHQARLAGLQVEVAPRVPLRTKIGGLIPIPAFLRNWMARGVVPGPAGEPLLEWGRAAAAAAAVAVAGIGAGSITGNTPIVDAHGYAPTPGLYSGGDADGSTAMLGSVSKLVGSERAMRQAAGPLASGPAGAGPLGAPVNAGPLAGPAQPIGAGPLQSTGPAHAAGPVAAGGLNAGTGAAAGLTQAAGGAVQGVTQTVGGTVNGVTQTAGGTVNGVTRTVGGTVNGVTQTAGGTVGGVTTTAGNAVQGVTQTAGGLVRDVTQNPANVGAAVDNAVRGTARTVGETVRGTTQTVNRTVQGTTQTVNNTVQGTTQTVNNTVQGTTQTVGGTVQGVANSLPRTTQSTAPATTSTPAPTTQSPTTTQQSAPVTGPVQQVVQNTTNAVGGLLGGG